MTRSWIASRWSLDSRETVAATRSRNSAKPASSTMRS
jgi:hypothetical protein